EVFGNRLRGSWKASVGLHVDRRQLAAKQLEKDRHERSARAADAVESDSESLFSDPTNVEKWQRENLLDMLPRGVPVLGDGAQLVPGGAGDVSVDHLP